MPTLNQLFLIGNLTRKPELRYTPKGTAVCNGGIAVNRRWTAENGDKKEEVCFVEFTAWAGTAETLARHTDKGSCVLIQGYLKFEQWEDDGTTRSKLFAVVESFQFLDSKPAEQKRK
jgi:single-strand DNA-binding protein